MKNIVILLIAFGALTVNQLMAQDANKVADKMAVFQSWVGHWQGSGSMRMGPGEPKTSTVDERIETRLNGNVVIVEGVGKHTENNIETVVHHAFGVLGFNPIKDEYSFRTFLMDGKTTDAWFKVIGENQYQWGFDAGNGKIRYTITINAAKSTWNEIGEYSADGNNWMKFFEMNLTKVD